MRMPSITTCVFVGYNGDGKAAFAQPAGHL